jgi:hypothetical protein
VLLAEAVAHTEHLRLGLAARPAREQTPMPAREPARAA